MNLEILCDVEACWSYIHAFPRCPWIETWFTCSAILNRSEQDGYTARQILQANVQALLLSFSRFLVASLAVHIFLLTWHPFLLASHLLNFLFLEFFFEGIFFSWHLCVYWSHSLHISFSCKLVSLSLSLLTFFSSDISVPWHLSHDIILLASLLSLDIHITQSWRSSLNAATTGLRNAIAPAHRRKPKVILAQQFDCTAHPPYCMPIAPDSTSTHAQSSSSSQSRSPRLKSVALKRCSKEF